MSNTHIEAGGRELRRTAMEAWNALEQFREDRRRNKDYTFGRQWRDVINTGAGYATEEEYLLEQGNYPLKNNLIRRLVRSVSGVFRERLDERLESLEGLGAAEALELREVHARTFEEFLISGLAVHRLMPGRRFTVPVSPDSFFLDPDARDPLGRDVRLVGQLHALRGCDVPRYFARDRNAWRRLEERYGDRRRVTVAEVWTLENTELTVCHDTVRGCLVKAPAEVWRRDARLRAMQSRWTREDVWRYRYLDEEGEVLASGCSPLGGQGHPFLFKAYPYIDGEIHSFVKDVIDQQKYTNRLITLYDWVMRASAKGVLLMPEDAVPPGADLDSMADEWSKFNGVLVYRALPGQPLPQQVSSTGACAGISDLLNIQLKMMEDIAGVNGALQGRVDTRTMSGSLYSQQRETSLTSLRDILESYEWFMHGTLMAAGLDLTTINTNKDENGSGGIVHTE